MVRFAFRYSLSHTNVQGNMTSTDGLSRLVPSCMKMYMLKLDIWKYIGRQSRNEIRTKTSLLGHVDFFPNFDKNSQISIFGRDLEEVWNIQIFGYLNILTDRRITAVTHSCYNYSQFLTHKGTGFSNYT
jgi:hypothetical protein